MILILARHGNTFEKGEVPRVVGAGEDIPLTEKGREQARVLGRALMKAGIAIDCVRAGPLKRTLEYALLSAASAAIQVEPEVDIRLRELDYGEWSGMSDSEIAWKYGEDVLEGWRKIGRRPATCQWSPAEADVRSNLRALLQEVRGNSLWVTSNGILRYAMELDPVAFAEKGSNGGFRVKTGNICALRLDRGHPRMLFWDAIPDSSLFRDQ